MSDRDAVLELVNRLPSTVSFRQIVQEIEFIAAVKEGLQELDQGQGVPLEEVAKLVELWSTK